MSQLLLGSDACSFLPTDLIAHSEEHYQLTQPTLEVHVATTLVLVVAAAVNPSLRSYCYTVLPPALAARYSCVSSIVCMLAHCKGIPPSHACLS